MYKLSKSVKYKVVLGATLGAFLTGGISIGLNNYNKPNTSSITYPFLLDDINIYGVTTQKYYIKNLNNEKWQISKENPEKIYMNPENLFVEEIGYYTNGKGSLSLSLFLPSTLNHDSVKKYITEYSGYFYIDDLTEQQLQQIIDRFENKKFKELFDSIPDHQKIQRTLDSTEVETKIYSAELTIVTIDYNDIKITQESRENNIFESCFTFASMLSGIQFGSLIGYSLGMEKCFNQSTNQQQEPKIRKRKKDY